MPHAKGYTWDQMYLDEYAKGKSFVLGKKPDRFIIWASEYLKDKHQNGAVILDAGCGEGRNSVYLAKQGFKMYGVDIASRAIEKAQRWIRSEGLTEIVNLRVGDVTRLPYEDDFFDAVIDSHTMEFILERERYVREVARVLKSEGFFCILTATPPSVHGLDSEFLKRTLDKENFEILKIHNPSNTSLSVLATRKTVRA